MKTTKFITLLIVIVSLVACGGSSGKHSADKKGFTAIEKDIKNKFGNNAYFTSLTITHNKSIGNIVGVTVTDAPESLKMGQWNQTQGKWQQNSDITIEIPSGTKATDFMFQLNNEINLEKLGELVEKSKEKLTREKKIENPALNMAFIKFPKNGDISKAEYVVSLNPENGGTTFSFFYKLDGALIKMDY